VDGAQLGVVNFSAGSAWFQYGVANMTGSFTGLQIGVLDISGSNSGSESSMQGGQIGVANFSADSAAFQIGVVNASEGVSNGFQLGVLNYTENPDGFPIGLVSIVRNGITRGEVWYDESGFANAGLRHGTGTIYNIYSVGMDTSYQDLKASLGIEVHLPVESFFFNIDALTSVIYGTAEGSRASFMDSLRLGLGIQITEELALTAGLSFNYFDNTYSASSLQPATGYKFPFGDPNHQFWPGFYAGIEF
jgi:hypothetical protein